MPDTRAFNPAECPLCGGPNDCLLCTTVAYKGTCWCTAVEIPHELLARVPETLRNRACICRSCIETFKSEPRAIEPLPPHPVRRAPELP